MDTFISAVLGLVFLTLGFAAVFLMFRIWGYPFDEQKHESTAPKIMVLTHRVVGICYVLLYLLMMYHMVPRLFLYQVEFPARTVAHLMLGVSIGFLLIIKLLILRSCRHFSSMLPYIGISILWCTVLLVSLSVPFAFKESYWSSSTKGGSVYSAENIERIQKLLPAAGFPPAAPLEKLASENTLRAGRQVLLTRCVTCHDLKTILTRPRPPVGWVRTVERMAKKPVFGRPIEAEEQWLVATYLIAISPDLQVSAKHRREQELQNEQSKNALITAIEAAAGATPVYDTEETRTLFEQTCSQCHELSEVENYPLTSAQDVRELLGRMVENGLEADEADLEQVVWYLMQTYVE
jgi:mono/diheme cytochrome c family protein